MGNTEDLRLLIVPRWGGGEDSDWYPFVRDRAAAGALPGVTEAALVALRPQADAPEIPASVEEIGRAVGGDLERTLLVGHSTGSRALLHYLASLPHGPTARGLLSVVGWWTLAEPTAAQRSWVEAPLDLERARQVAGPVRALISDNDPRTADHDETRRLWIERMGAEVAIRKGARHFNGAHEISVLINLAALLDQSRKSG